MSFEADTFELSRTVITKSLLYKDVKYVFVDPAGARHVGIATSKLCGLRGFNVVLKHETTEDVLFEFDVTSCLGFCDKYVVKDGSGSEAAELREPSMVQKCMTIVCPCGGNKLLMSVRDATGEALFDLRTPSECCRCGCCQCSCDCCGPIAVSLNVTEPGEPTVLAGIEVEAPRFIPGMAYTGATATVKIDTSKMGAKATNDSKRALLALAIMADLMYMVPNIAPCAC